MPARFMGALGSGELTVASHRQVNAFPGAGWLVQVIATAVVRERSFVVASP